MTSASSIEDNKQRNVSLSKRDSDGSSSSSSCQQQIESSKASNDSYWRLNSPMVGGHVTDACHPSNKYWDWDGSNAKKNRMVESHVKSILAYEAARVMLSADNIVKQLQQTSGKNNSSASSIETLIQNESDEYLTHREVYGDEYWHAVVSSISAKNKPALAVGNNGYWD